MEHTFKKDSPALSQVHSGGLQKLLDLDHSTLSLNVACWPSNKQRMSQAVVSACATGRNSSRAGKTKGRSIFAIPQNVIICTWSSHQ